MCLYIFIFINQFKYAKTNKINDRKMKALCDNIYKKIFSSFMY